MTGGIFPSGIFPNGIFPSGIFQGSNSSLDEVDLNYPLTAEFHQNTLTATFYQITYTAELDQ